MKIKRVFGIIPVPVFFTDSLPEKFGGASYGLFIKLRPKYEKDEGLLQHELVHSQQFWLWTMVGCVVSALMYFTKYQPLYWYVPAAMSMMIHPLAYKFYVGYRFECEVHAYAVQMEVNGWTEPPVWMVDALMNKYDFNFTKEYIISALSEAKE